MQILCDDGNVIEAQTPYEIAIFHELVHWFQFLFDPIRFHIEMNNMGDTINICGENNGQIWTNMGKYYKIYLNNLLVGVETWERKAKVAKIWEAAKDNAIGFHEMRVILGESCDGSVDSIYDLISENAMRIFLQYSIRIGCN
ncbi:MAG: hypothetical protein LBB12_04550, partial [Holosporaceae bacterium]|nr:hypothetical protein [Holosporaceae bacterium]